jgi:geranylgeranyl diphosphate synthase, type I
VDLNELSGYIPKIESTLRASYATERRRAAPAFRPFLDILTEFSLRGGKRFRALLVLAGFHITTGRAPTPVLSAAAALEHFQSWMLIHDDIIDHSEQRRGGPTVHRSLERDHAAHHRIGSSVDYGIGMGVTLGDLQEPFTVEALLSTPVASPAKLAALAEYVRMTRETAYGQVMDIWNGTVPPGEVSEQDVLTVHRLKSAVYTVASPLRIGALLGGERLARLGDLTESGIDLGIAFQLRDDILGAGIDADQSGKSANDLIEGKRTLLVVRAWHAADADGRALLERVLGNPAASLEEIDAVRDLIRSSGSLAYSERKIRQLTDRALKRIDRSRTIRAAGRPLLKQIADRLVNRSI